MMQPEQLVAQKFTKTTLPLSASIVVFCPAIEVKLTSGAVGRLPIRVYVRPAAKARTSRARKIFFIDVFSFFRKKPVGFGLSGR